MISTSNIVKAIKKAVLDIEPNSEIILFGSRARGDEKKHSDWDILILVPNPTDLQEERKFRHNLFDVELQYGQAISTIVKSKNEWKEKFKFTPLYKNVLSEGIVL